MDSSIINQDLFILSYRRDIRFCSLSLKEFVPLVNITNEDVYIGIIRYGLSHTTVIELLHGLVRYYRNFYLNRCYYLSLPQENHGKESKKLVDDMADLFNQFMQIVYCLSDLPWFKFSEINQIMVKAYSIFCEALSDIGSTPEDYNLPNTFQELFLDGTDNQFRIIKLPYSITFQPKMEDQL